MTSPRSATATARRATRSWRASSGSSPSWRGADVPLRHVGVVDLPPHLGDDGFDHAAVHSATGRVYVAHTANDAIDVIDLSALKHIASVGGLRAVAGALVSE